VENMIEGMILRLGFVKNMFREGVKRNSLG
jgi:hypothetical protein